MLLYSKNCDKLYLLDSNNVISCILLYPNIVDCSWICVDFFTQHSNFTHLGAFYHFPWSSSAKWHKLKSSHDLDPGRPCDWLELVSVGWRRQWEMVESSQVTKITNLCEEIFTDVVTMFHNKCFDVQFENTCQIILCVYTYIFSDVLVCHFIHSELNRKMER